MATEVKYYRKAGTCRRVVTPTLFNYITLPPESSVALRAHQEFEKPEQLTEAMKGFEEVTHEEWKSFLATFYQAVAKERHEVFN